MRSRYRGTNHPQEGIGISRPPDLAGDSILHYCEDEGTLLSSIIPECKEVTKEDGMG
jgi:hypothetical protein